MFRATLARVGLSNQAAPFPRPRGRSPDVGQRARTVGKGKAARRLLAGKGLESWKARVHVEVSVLIFGEGNGQRAIAAFVFHVIGLCPEIDQAWALFLGKEPNLLGVFTVPESTVEGGNRDGLPITDDAPDLLAWTRFEIGSGLFRLQGGPLIEAEGLVHEGQQRFRLTAWAATEDVSLSAQGIPV